MDGQQEEYNKNIAPGKFRGLCFHPSVFLKSVVPLLRRLAPQTLHNWKGPVSSAAHGFGASWALSASKKKIQWAKWQWPFRAWADMWKTECGLTTQTLHWGNASCRGNRHGHNFRRWLRGKRQSYQHPWFSWGRQNRIHANSDQRQRVDAPTTEKQAHGKLPMDSTNPVGWEVMVQTPRRSHLRKILSFDARNLSALGANPILGRFLLPVSAPTTAGGLTQSQRTSPQATRSANGVTASQFSQAGADQLYGGRWSQPCSRVGQAY